MPNIVPPGLLTSALALSTATWSSSALVGPAFAGSLLVAVGPASVFAINGAATIVALAATSTIAVPAAPPRPPDGKRTAGLLAGASYLRHNRRVLCLVGMMVVAMTGALGVETLLPLFAVKTWHAGAIGYGLLRMAPGIAAVVAGLGLVRPSFAKQPGPPRRLLRRRRGLLLRVRQRPPFCAGPRRARRRVAVAHRRPGVLR